MHQVEARATHRTGRSSWGWASNLLQLAQQWWLGKRYARTEAVPAGPA